MFKSLGNISPDVCYHLQIASAETACALLMHKYLNEYPPAPAWREQRAAMIFPYKELGAEEYAAREAHNWVCFSYGEFYSDSDLNEWIHSLDDIFFTRGAVEAAREKYLTQEQILSIELSKYGSL